MKDARAESLIEDLGSLLEMKRDIVQSAYPALESALLLGFPRPVILGVWQIATGFLREAYANIGVPGIEWRTEDTGLLNHLDTAISSTRIRSIIRDLARLVKLSLDPSDTADLSIEQGHDAVEDLLGFIGWIQARKLVTFLETRRPASPALNERASLVLRIYRTLGFIEVTQRELSETTIFLLLEKKHDFQSEYIQVFISEDLSELQAILSDSTILQLTHTHNVARTLIIADAPEATFQERLISRGEIQSLAAFIADLVGYRDYVVKVRQQFKESLVSNNPILIEAEVLRFDEHCQDYVIDRVGDVDVFMASALEANAGNLLVLADSGGGKTFLCERVLDRLLADRNNRFAVYFHLGMWLPGITLGDFVAQEMCQFSKFSTRELASLFSLLGSEGYIVCILDAFDECVHDTGNEGVLYRLASITQLLTKRSRVVLTSRISFFQATPELRKLLNRDAISSEKISQALTPTGVDPLALPNFRVMRLRRVQVELDEVLLELTPLEIQLLLSRPAGSRRALISYEEERVNGSILVESEILKAIPQHRHKQILDELTQYFGTAYQASKTSFHLTDLHGLANGSLFGSTSLDIDTLLIRNVLKFNHDNSFRFRHMAYLEFLFARQLAFFPENVKCGTRISDAVRRFLFEITSLFSSGLYNNDLVLPASTPFIIGAGDQSHVARIKRDIQVQRQAVTVAEYREFLNEIYNANIREFEHPLQPNNWSHIPPRDRLKVQDYYSNEEFLAHPANCVSWWSAYAYARFYRGRLLSANEWEFASRGRDGRLFPWGDAVKIGKANSADFWAGRLLLTWEEWKNHFDSSGIRGGLPLPASQFPLNISPWGILGLAGNIWEWTETVNPTVTRAGIMGASFDNPFRALRSSVRCFNTTSGLSNAIGFRWCKELE